MIFALCVIFMGVNLFNKTTMGTFDYSNQHMTSPGERSIIQIDLQVWITSDKTSDISTGHCKCIAGLSKTCLHIAAVLFLCE